MNRKSIVIFVSALLFVAFPDNIIANENSKATVKNVQIELKQGDLHLNDIFIACPELAATTVGKSVNKNLVGKILNIKNKKYELRYFSFEDTRETLSLKLTFKEYITSNNLLLLTSSIMSPLPGIVFESFDFRKANLGDGVYFSMALRLLQQ